MFELNKDRKQKEKLPVFIKIIIAVLAAADIGMMGVLISVWSAMSINFGQVQTQLSYLVDTANVIQNEVSNMESNIEATLEAENSMLEDYQIQVTDYNFAEGTYDVAITILPKEYTDTTQAIIYFGTQEYYLQLNGFAYEGTATLPLATRYDGNVTLLLMDGNKKTTEVLNNYQGFQSKIQGLIKGSLEKNPTYDNGVLSLISGVNYSLDNSKGYEFETLEVILTAGGQEVYYYDLLEEDDNYHGEYVPIQESETDEDFLEDEETPEDGMEEIVQNPADEEHELADTEFTEPQEEGEQETEEEDIPEKGYLQRATVHSAISGGSGQAAVNVRYEMESSMKVRVFLRAITTDGLIVEYDLFNGYTRASGTDFQFSSDYNAENYMLYDQKGGSWNPSSQ